ncbi:MAG: hypothetical protein GX079_01380 [Tissierellia bacterium]|nr:hypothetical protein [Tissierellia bacterium]
MKSALDFAHLLIPEMIVLAVDATVGHGKDTLILANRAEKVVGFEIQEEAYNCACQLLSPFNVELFNVCHSRMAEFLNEEPEVIVFNLGYLPGGSKDITTEAATTKKAILAGFKLLKKGGRIIIVAYGHIEGQEEIEMLKTLEFNQKEADVFRMVHYNGINNPPEAWLIVKK